MAFRKLVILVSVLLPLIFAKLTSADLSDEAIASHGQNGAVFQPNAAELEFHQLKSEITILEKGTEDQIGKLKIKDGGIKQLEKIIEEKSISLVALQSEVRSLKEKGSIEVKERIGQVNARVYELEKQIFNIEKEIEVQNKRKDELKTQAGVAENEIEGLNLKLENLRKINGEQKSIISNTRLALKVAEEEMLKAKLEGSSKPKLRKESVFLAHWNEIGRPALDRTIKKALEQIYEVEKLMQPHLETLKTKWLQTIQGQYFQAAKKFTSPYIDRVSERIKPRVDEAHIYLKPRVDEAHIYLKPYSEKMVHYYKMTVENVELYHSLVQETLRKTLDRYEFTKPLARDTWAMGYMISIVMSLPVIVLSRIIHYYAEKYEEEKRNHRKSKRPTRLNKK